MRHLLRPPALLLTPFLHATTYHVATTGSDSNDGLDLPTAWATLQYAADQAVAGDSVVVHGGAYQGFAAMDHSGTVADPIVFTASTFPVLISSPCAYNGLDGINVENVSWVVIEGFHVNNMPRAGIRTAVSDHVTLRYNVCDGNGKWGILTGFAENVLIEHNTCTNSQDEHGIYVSNSADAPIVRYNTLYGNNANGLHMNGDASMGGDGVISNARIHGNTVFGNGAAGGSGINCDGVVNAEIFNNVLYDNHSSGISLYRIDGGAPSTGNKVFNNTVINAADARWCLNITEDCTGNQVLNNILINQHPWRGSIVIASSALPGFVSDHNLVVNSLSPDGDATILDLAGWQALGYDANSLVADPQAVLFADPLGGHFQPVGPGAQMVDAGTSAVSAIVTEDLDGLPRPQGAGFDIGCYELGISTGIGAGAAATPTVLLAPDHLSLPGADPNARVDVLAPDGKVIVQGARPERVPLPPSASGLLLVRMIDAAGLPIQVIRVVRAGQA